MGMNLSTTIFKNSVCRNGRQNNDYFKPDLGFKGLTSNFCQYYVLYIKSKKVKKMVYSLGWVDL